MKSFGHTARHGAALIAASAALSLLLVFDAGPGGAEILPSGVGTGVLKVGCASGQFDDFGGGHHFRRSKNKGLRIQGEDCIELDGSSAAATLEDCDPPGPSSTCNITFACPAGNWICTGGAGDPGPNCFCEP